MNSSSQGFIRPAVDGDLPIIEAWLSEQQEAPDIDTLACNWEITKEVYRERGTGCDCDASLNQCPNLRIIGTGAFGIESTAVTLIFPISLSKASAKKTVQALFTLVEKE